MYFSAATYHPKLQQKFVWKCFGAAICCLKLLIIIFLANQFRILISSTRGQGTTWGKLEVSFLGEDNGNETFVLTRWDIFNSLFIKFFIFHFKIVSLLTDFIACIKQFQLIYLIIFVRHSYNFYVTNLSTTALKRNHSDIHILTYKGKKKNKKELVRQ